ncbi:MAG: glycosyltransferase family 4 protein [Pseudomonadota bacterium]
MLYISYTGLLDPLGQSQVLQYVLGLARQYRMTVLTFEKPDALKDTAQIEATAEKCRAAGVGWHRLAYHNRPGIPATLYDIAMGMRRGIKLAKACRADIVHTRSYIAGMIGMAVKRETGARFIFDMRGFWPDERVDGGIWKAGSRRYKFFKGIERRLFTSADHVVSLTRAGVREYEQFDYLADNPPPSTVIPTCTNLELFRPTEVPDDRAPGFTIGYVGSAGSWYMFDEVTRAVRLLFEKRQDARFHVVNKGDHGFIRNCLNRHGVDLERTVIRTVPYGEVATEIAHMDAGIFFIKPVWSKRASSPTRLGEFLACGKPVLVNGNVGDVAESVGETQTGIAISAFDDATLQDGLDRLLELTEKPGISARCRDAAEARFSLEGGIQSYSAIYDRLAAAIDKRVE